MKTEAELRAFCEGYLKASLACYAVRQAWASWDDWVVWGGYDINFTGAEYSSLIKDDGSLRVNAYKAGWKDAIGEPIHSFTIEGESK